MTLDNKKFKVKENQQGISSSKTIFHYAQTDEIITANYAGGKIKSGSIIGKQISENQIELLYHCLTNDGELLAGRSSGTVTKNENDLLEINFDWKWLNGDQSSGKSHYIEMR